MRVRALLLFILAALTWVTPLTAHQQTALPADASILARHDILDVAVDATQPCEEPLLLEEESKSEIDREPAGFSSTAAPPVSSSWSDLPARFAVPTESRIVSSATPRGPPAAAL